MGTCFFQCYRNRLPEGTNNSLYLLWSYGFSIMSPPLGDLGTRVRCDLASQRDVGRVRVKTGRVQG